MPQNPQRDFAVQVVSRLRDAGFQALWAGGCVRDGLLEISPKDYDVATSATPDEVRQVFGRKRTIAVGASFGVITVLGPREAGQIEIATFRTDGGYSDGRHPDKIEFSTPEHDAQRRDFTINGLFYDPLADEVLDYVDGQQDLAAGVIRAIGNPESRIAEDKLRMLRAVRFAARFDFEIDTTTMDAIVVHAGEITQVSGERIGAEMRSMLLHPNRAKALELLRDTGLEPYVLPEVAECQSDAWQQAARLQSPSLALVLALLLTKADKNDSAIASVVARWKLPNRDSDLASWLLKHLSVVESADEIAWPQLQRILIQDGAGELVELLAILAGEDSPAVQCCRQKLALEPSQLNPSPLVKGAELIAAGIEPGPRFGTILESIRDAQLVGEISTPDQAIALARELDN